MSRIDWLMRLMLAADLSAARTGDRVLERAVEEVWARVCGRRNGPERCTRTVVAGEQRARCVLPRWHEGECEFWLQVRWEPDGVLEVRAGEP